MDLKTKIAGVVVAILALFGVYSGAEKVGSVDRGNEYQATTTLSTWANTPQRLCATTSGSCTLGSVIIGTTHGSIVEIWNATSSTDIASTSLLVLAASPAIGSTLTIDADAPRGIMVNTVTGFTGRYTITFRQ